MKIKNKILPFLSTTLLAGSIVPISITSCANNNGFVDILNYGGSFDPLGTTDISDTGYITESTGAATASVAYNLKPELFAHEIYSNVSENETQKSLYSSLLMKVSNVSSHINSQSYLGSDSILRINYTLDVKYKLKDSNNESCITYKFTNMPFKLVWASAPNGNASGYFKFTHTNNLMYDKQWKTEVIENNNQSINYDCNSYNEYLKGDEVISMLKNRGFASKLLSKQKFNTTGIAIPIVTSWIDGQPDPTNDISSAAKNEYLTTTEDKSTPKLRFQTSKNACKIERTAPVEDTTKIKVTLSIVDCNLSESSNIRRKARLAPDDFTESLESNYPPPFQVEFSEDGQSVSMMFDTPIESGASSIIFGLGGSWPYEGNGGQRQRLSIITENTETNEQVPLSDNDFVVLNVKIIGGTTDVLTTESAKWTTNEICYARAVNPSWGK